jgi:hypothetical protein
MTLGLDDLRMMASAVFEMFGLQAPEGDAEGPAAGVIWAHVSLGDGDLTLDVGLDRQAVDAFVMAFSDAMSPGLHDPRFEAAAVCELANVIGGNLRGVLELTGPLGLPAVVAGVRPEAEVIGFASDTAGQIWLGLTGIAVHG